MISFVIPAHNEEAWIGRTLDAIRDSMETIGGEHEIIVVDDASTDRTAAIAAERGAIVLPVEHRQIARVRNAGATAAKGEHLFFVDADTLVNAEVIREALRSMEAGAVGGGCVPKFDGRIPLWWRPGLALFGIGVRISRLPSGCFLFAQRGVFHACGGFGETHYAAEEAVFGMAMKRHGRFVVLKASVLTSGRNLRAYSCWSILQMLANLTSRGRNALRSREGLDLWYRPLRRDEG